MFVQQHQDSSRVARDTSGISSRLGRSIGTSLEVRRETQGPIQVGTVILGFLSVFKRSQASSPFEALNSACLAKCQSDMRPPIEMRLGQRDSSRVSTGDSDFPLSCEIKEEPAFKSHQGNPAFFQIRASRCPLHFRQQIQGPSHKPIAERSLLMRCLLKVGIPLESKPGNQLSSRDDLGYTELSSSCCAELHDSLDLGHCSWGISEIA